VGNNTVTHNDVWSGSPTTHRFTRLGRTLAILGLLGGLVGSMIGGRIPGARAADLVMFESAACSWCLRWHEEVGPIYPKTPESRRAPLRRVALHDPWPEDLKAVHAVSFTPTFVLVDEGRELGRITGYAGDAFFWFQLDTLLEKLPDDRHAGQ